MAFSVGFDHFAFFLWNAIAAQGWITKLCLNGVERSSACSIPEQKCHYVVNNIVNLHLSDFSHQFCSTIGGKTDSCTQLSWKISASATQYTICFEIMLNQTSQSFFTRLTGQLHMVFYLPEHRVCLIWESLFDKLCNILLTAMHTLNVRFWHLNQSDILCELDWIWLLF